MYPPVPCEVYFPGTHTAPLMAGFLSAVFLCRYLDWRTYSSHYPLRIYTIRYLMTGPLHRYLLSRIFPEYLIELTIMLSILYSVPMYTLAIVTLIYDFLSHRSLSHFPLQSSLMILIFTKSHLSPTVEERCPFPSRQATRKRVFLQGGRQVLGEPDPIPPLHSPRTSFSLSEI